MPWSLSDILGGWLQPNAQQQPQQPLVVGQQGYPNPDPRAYPPGGPQLAPKPPPPPFYDPTMGRPPPPYDPTMDPRPTPPVPGVTVNTNPVIGQSVGPQAAIDAAPYLYSGAAKPARGMTPSQVGQKVGGRTTAGGTGDTGGLNNSDGSVNKGAGSDYSPFSNYGGGSLNKGFGTPDSQLAAAAPATDGSINKGDGAPAPSGPQSIFGQTKADLGAGSYGKAFGDIFGNDKLMGGVAGLAGALRGGSQGSGASALPPPPNLTDNSASIAQQAPQLLAQTMARRKKTPGLSLSGVNRGFGG